MGKSKLKSALDTYKGKDFHKEKQKKLRKEAEKKKRSKKAKQLDEDEEEGGVGVNGLEHEAEGVEVDEEVEEAQKEAEAGWETDENEDEEALDTSKLIDNSDSESEVSGDDDEEDPEADEDDEDIPLSDLASIASEEKGDIIPYQRLKINNTSALMAAVQRIAIPVSKLEFSEHQSITTDEPIEISDIEDDLNRELAFYKQSLAAAEEARRRLKKEGVPFSRPTDFFAEMVKSDEHMDKIKAKIVDEAARKRAAADARKQRDLKKFGKAVQVAKQQERDKAKKDTLEKINILKRKRANAPLANENEEDMFDVALDDEVLSKPSRGDRDGKSNSKRQKDSKFGFGGKKRFAKSNDATSSADTRGFNHKKMKGKVGGAKQRPGKSRRAKKA